MSKTANVLVGCPTHDGRLDEGTARGLFAGASHKRSTIAMSSTSSLLNLNCNGLWCEALNRRKDGLEWFALLHADISPEIGWLDKLIDEAELHGADMLSAVSPIKDQRGLCSTAIEDPDNEWVAWCRIGLKQLAHESFPETFDSEMAISALATLPEPMRIVCKPGSKMLANTACMVVRLNREWSNDVCFHTKDAILTCGDGIRRSFVQPEDWMFSRAIANEGGRVMVTKKITLEHRGISSYPSNGAWGYERDQDCESDRKSIASHSPEISTAA